MTLTSLARNRRSGQARFLWLWALTFVLGLGAALAPLATSVWAEEDPETTSPQGAQAESNGGHGLVLTIDGAIGPATMDYVVRGLERAADQDASLVIITLNTPGGLMDAMRSIIQEILNSPIPVATYVSPSGARAASAGTYIHYSSHVAAMAPATHLGSATPIQMGGTPGAPDDSSPEQDRETEETTDESESGNGGSSEETRRGETAMERKMLEDAVAYIRELAERHGRNADWAEKAVREAVNLGASEAVEMNVADVVATDIDDLLNKIHGRTVVMASGEATLDTENLELTTVEPDWRTRLLSVITDPNIAYFLMIIGFYGLIFELASPGTLFPGVIGAISLILALFAFQVLSVNYAGLALIFLGLAFIVGEAFMPSFGVLGVGGIIAFVVGSVILMDGTNQEVSLPLIGGVALIASGFMLWVITRFLTLRKRHAVSGKEQLLHEEALAKDDFVAEKDRYKGKVTLSGERWNAVSDSPVSEGQALEVTDLKGLTVYVTPKES